MGLPPQVKLVLHLGRDPHDLNSKFFLLDGLARANNDLPRIVHSAEQHGHFRRPRPVQRRAFPDQRRKLIRRSFGFSHIISAAKSTPHFCREGSSVHSRAKDSGMTLEQVRPVNIRVDVPLP
jgi:hypothetical protein